VSIHYKNITGDVIRFPRSHVDYTEQPYERSAVRTVSEMIDAGSRILLTGGAQGKYMTPTFSQTQYFTIATLPQ
jgi:hypothetical protein